MFKNQTKIDKSSNPRAYHPLPRLTAILTAKYLRFQLLWRPYSVMDKQETEDNMEIEEEGDATWGWEFPEIHDVDPTKCMIFSAFNSIFFWIFGIIGRSNGKTAAYSYVRQEKRDLRIYTNKFCRCKQASSQNLR